MRQMLIPLVLGYLRFWARRAVDKHKPVIIGVAGSVGKSSTCQAIYAVLRDHVSTKLIKGNSETGIPLGLLGLEVKSLGFDTFATSSINWLSLLLRAPFGINYLQRSKYIIVEMGIDEPNPPKNMEYLLTIIKPDIAIELNIAPPHLGQFEALLKGKDIVDKDKLDFLLDRMAAEDTKIITKSQSRVGIYNHDDKRVTDVIDIYAKKSSKTELVSFGSAKQNSISYDAYAVSSEKTSFSFVINQQSVKMKVQLEFENTILPEAYRETFAATILVGLSVDLSLDQIRQSLEKNFYLPKGRSSVFAGIHETTIIDSSYNASPKAVLTFLDLLQQLKKQTKRPVVFLFGDMRELGSEAEEEHEKVAKEIAKVVDYLYCVGPLTREFVIQQVEHANKELKEIRWFDSSVRAGEYLEKHLPMNAIVLVKGSQNTIYLEEAVKYLLKHKTDEQKLCRQETYWLEKKKQTTYG